MGSSVFRYIFKVSFYIALSLISVTFAIGFLLTFAIKSSSEQKLFLKGIVPDSPMSGFYDGSSSYFVGSWRGKFFNQQDSTGINYFTSGLGVGSETRHPFETYVGSGIQDKNIKVLKLDYDVSENPFWLRLILDEIVQTEENKYLGKIHVRLIPNFPFTLAFFRLQRQ